MNNKGRRFLMTIPERKLYYKIKKNLGNDFVILPQICIRSLMATDYDIDNRYKWCIVDYLICKKPYYEPYLVIELDDPTHSLPDRKIRDIEVEKILTDIDLPIWRIPDADKFNPFDMNLNISIKAMFDAYPSSKMKRKTYRKREFYPYLKQDIALLALAVYLFIWLFSHFF